MNNKVNDMKNDKKCLNDYIKCFINGNKANELLQNNQDFKRLKTSIKER